MRKFVLAFAMLAVSALAHPAIASDTERIGLEALSPESATEEDASLHLAAATTAAGANNATISPPRSARGDRPADGHLLVPVYELIDHDNSGDVLT